MDYYQQARPPASAAQPTHQYVQYSGQAGTTSSQMYYQQQTMGHQPQQPPSYQFPMQAPSGTTNMDYGHSLGATQQSGMSGSHNPNQHHQQSAVIGQAVQQRRGISQRSGPPPVDSAAPIQNATHMRLSPQQELPLRIVIDSKHVGAIIGTGGNNVREITKESKARVVVDVQRTVKDQQGHSEKIISILGHLDNCSKACVKILEVVQRENEKDETKDNSEVELKIRAHNQLVGRLIGKQGATIKKIMQDTGTTIFVSNEQTSRAVELSSMGGLIPPFPDAVLTMERTITVKGPSIDVVSAAEQKISARLRQSYETDLQHRMSFTGIPTMPGMIHPIGDAYAALAASTMRPIGGPLCGVGGRTDVSKTTRMWVPNSMVGAIIGSKGSHIRNIIRNSGANVRIEGGSERRDIERKEEAKDTESHAEDEKTQPETPAVEERRSDADGERLVTITGNDAQQYRAQFLIFNRVAEQSQHLIDEVKLRTELTVPSRLVGRIIGKGGQNVRELQRITGASVKIPEDEPKATDLSFSDEPKEGSSSPPPSDSGTVVRIVGNFLATQSVQVRIGQLISDFQRATNLHVDRRKEELQDSSRKLSSPTHVNGAE
ncbi:KH domain protein [Dictyocaulus viviparus]|uniref:KH domain protein n=1 Tax=Dictyocaulus viviparus TaxID=29172 RepID=A0A0D8Y1M9_DICVI|nr:KH domain protein [Dictyocaulus viviparus]